MSSRKETLERMLANAQRELEKIAARPPEPPYEESGEATVVRFDLRYADTDRLYSFAAIRAGHYWYTTATRGNTFPSWDAMLDALDLEGRLVGKVWVVTEYQEVGP